LSYVAQDSFLFHDTIRRNLLLAYPAADENALWHALEISGVEDIVRRSPGGLDTVLGERGVLVSGGERQRPCLARAMLRRPHLLILDEALLGRLLQAKPRPTIIMIAHRLESLRYCQRVLHFEGGAVVSDCSHDDWLKAKQYPRDDSRGLL
jgi:ATP-binding cassette, subfamily C, bacterial